MANQNTTEYLDKIKTRLFENLRMLPHAPGVQMQGKECYHKYWSDLGDKQYQGEYRISEMGVKRGLHKFFEGVGLTSKLKATTGKNSEI